MSIVAGVHGATGVGANGESDEADGPKLDPALEKQKLEAEARKVIADAELAIAEARRKQISAFIPDVSAIKTGETTLKSESPLAAAGLIYRAVESAAVKLVGGITDGELRPGSRVLVTDDLDLATADAVYVEVTSGLGLMTEAADKVLEVVEAQRTLAETVGAVVSAIAAALPAVVSLFSAHRTVSSAAATVDAAATMAIVAGELKRRNCVVVVDDFRLVPTAGEVFVAETVLRERVTRLRTLRLNEKVAQDTAEADKVTAQSEVDELMKRLEKGGSGNDGPALEPRLADARGRRHVHSVAALHARGQGDCHRSAPGGARPIPPVAAGCADGWQALAARHCGPPPTPAQHGRVGTLHQGGVRVH